MPDSEPRTKGPLPPEKAPSTLLRRVLSYGGEPGTPREVARSSLVGLPMALGAAAIGILTLRDGGSHFHIGAVLMLALAGFLFYGFIRATILSLLNERKRRSMDEPDSET